MSKKFHSIFASNPTNALRGQDKHGNGRYGASRGGRAHEGVDIKCGETETVLAPFEGKIVRKAAPYSGVPKQEINNGFVMTGTGDWTGYEAKMFYVKLTVPIGTTVKGGDSIATHLRMQNVYEKITEHAHLELSLNGQRLDPTPYL